MSTSHVEPKLEPASKPDVSSLDLTATLNVLHSMVDHGSLSSPVLSNKTSATKSPAEATQRINLPDLKSKSCKPISVPASLHVHLCAEVLKAVQDLDGGVEDVDEWTVFNVELPPPLPPEAPVDIPSKDTRCSDSWLHPPTPTVTVESKREAYSEKLMEYCLLKNQPITIIRGLPAALKLGLIPPLPLASCVH